jgi:DNA repair protein RadC
MNIKKRVKFEDENEEEDVNKNSDMFSFFKSQINEENALLLVILMLASRNEMDEYIKLYLKTSDILTLVVRCVLILLIYLIFKNFVLPKIKL